MHMHRAPSAHQPPVASTMLRCHPLPSYLLLFTAILAAGGCGGGASQCHQDQRDALLRLKAGFRFNPGVSDCPPEYQRSPSKDQNLSSWKEHTNCCTWEGVTCDNALGYVTALDLTDLAISGNLSSPDMFKLTSLRFLSLACNDFEASPWPSPGFERLTHLEYLDLSYSGLPGDLRVENGQLSNVVALNLSGLELKDLNFLTLIDSLGNLQQLYLQDVKISVGPTNLSHASSARTTSGLKELSMRRCSIANGRFDTFLANLLLRSKLADLVMLQLSDFDLTSLSLHALIGSLGNLQKLYLENVKISATPKDLAHASSANKSSGLRELSMRQGTITSGRFDTVLTKLPLFHNLIKLDLSVLDLKNLSVDALINNLGSLQKLYLDFVNISVSPIRSAHASPINTTPVLQELSMVDCGLTGTFPSWIFHIKNLTVLDVSQNENLCGELPEFIQGSALQVLTLRETKFSGKIPESIGNLRNLTMLDLSNCQFHGLVPPYAHLWPKIRVVDLSSNNLTGSLPSHGSLPLRDLTKLVLTNNSISGEIPAYLFSHPSLEYLDLSLNNFTGNFLLDPNASSNLAYLDLSKNKLQGPIPKLLSELVGIYNLDLSSNNFTGTVDLSFIKNYKELDYLSLSYNKLSVVEEDGNHSYAKYPTIRELELVSCNLSYVPKFLKHQRSISLLDISNNNIGGHIPDWIWEIEWSLGSLNLCHNQFTSVATNLSNSSVFYLDLHSNKIEGTLPLPPLSVYGLDYSNNNFSSIMPEFWSRFNFVEYLSLAKNNLTGEVSPLICNVTSIQVLDLSFNSFSGLIPPCLLKDNKGIEILILRSNNFHGSLPPDISKECSLEILDLNGNKLEGKLPESMVNCDKLQVLDLGKNLIVDTFPEWLGVLPLLEVLVLRSNGFHGQVDDYRMSKQIRPFFPMLQVLDLSSNSFNGSVPTQFLKQLKAMMTFCSGAPSMYVGILGPESAPSPGPTIVNPLPDYKDPVTVTHKGQETTLVQIFSIYRSLDLSNNNFEGIIPDVIGNLKCLRELNLSRNSLSGGIPPQIANMLQLESLDLSYSQLSGEIPPAMAKMSFLGVLNLSYNHLSGMIPQSSQFLTFPETSFLGNDGLCGKPLPRPCDPNHTPSAAATPGSSKEVNWEFLSIEAGIVSGLIIVFVTTLLWSNGRRWLYWQVDKFLLDVLQPWIGGRRH